MFHMRLMTLISVKPRHHEASEIYEIEFTFQEHGNGKDVGRRVPRGL